MAAPAEISPQSAPGPSPASSSQGGEEAAEGKAPGAPIPLSVLPPTPLPIAHSPLPSSLPSPVHLLTPSPVPRPAPLPVSHSPLPCLPSLPPLSPTESHLLTHFLILRYDMVELAERNKLNAAELLTFAQSPAVQAHLAELRKFSEQAFALRALESRIGAIDALERVIKSNPEPVETRRAASAILRGLNPPGGVPLRSHPLRSDTLSFRTERRKPSEYPSDSDMGPASPDSPSPSDTPLPTAHSPLPHDALLNQSARPAIPHPPHNRKHAPPPPPADAPFASPSPDISEHAAAELIRLILTKRTRRHLLTLRNFCMPTAKLKGIPIPTDQDTFLFRAEEVLHTLLNTEAGTLRRPPSAAAPTDLISQYQVAFGPGGPTPYTFELRRQSTSDPWRVSALTKGDLPPDP